MTNKMFTINGQRVRTWNPIAGCLYGCSYCYARSLAKGKLKHLSRYRDGFVPKLIEKELEKRFKGEVVFITDMGDAFGPWVPREWIVAVIEAIRRSPDATFLFLTKRPARYYDFLKIMPSNVILGATIESSYNYPSLSNAPLISDRAHTMYFLPRRVRRFVSVEPILDFDLHRFTMLLRAIEPEFIYIGFDNHNHHLPEPPLEKTRELIAALGEFTEVRTKTLREPWKAN